MCKRLVLLISIVMLFACSPADAAWRLYQDLASTHDFSDGNNWVNPYDGPNGIMIDPSGADSVGLGWLGVDMTGKYMEIDSGDGDLTCQEFRYGWTFDTFLRMKPGSGTLNCNGPTWAFTMAYAGSRDKLEMQGGTISIPNAQYGLNIGRLNGYGDHVLDQTGGLIKTVQVRFSIWSSWTGCSGNKYYLRGGILEITRQDPIHGSIYTNQNIPGNEFLLYDGGEIRLDKVTSSRLDEAIALVNDGAVKDGHGGRCLWNFDDSDPNYTSISVTNNPGGAYGPTPASGSQIDRHETTFTWNAGDYAVKETIYFGTDKDLVDAADASMIYRAERAVTNALTLDAPMNLDTYYYMRVDNNDTNGVTHRGPLWTYRCREYVEVDDIEGYASGTIQNTWQDWHTHLPATNGATVTTAISPVRKEYFMNLLLYESFQSMQMSYTDDFGGKSELKRAFASGAPQRDWTQSGVAGLSLYFHGLDDNEVDSDGIYVAVEDGDGNDAVAYYPDPTAVVQGVWSLLWAELNVSVLDMAAAGVDTTNVAAMYLGIGDYDAGTGDADGIVYFEDIRLYPSRCVYEGGPDADFRYNYDGVWYYDCTVGYEDLRVMGGSWLQSEPGAVTAAAGVSTLPVVRWSFDETDPCTTYVSSDSSGCLDPNVYTLETSTLVAPTINDAERGWVASLTGGYCLEAWNTTPNPANVEFWDMIDDEITISWWSRGDETVYNGLVDSWPAAGAQCFSGTFWAGNYQNLFVQFPMIYQLEAGGLLFRCGDRRDLGLPLTPQMLDDVRRTNTKGNLFYGQWNHIAMTKNINTGIQKVYINGEIFGMETNRFYEFNPLTAPYRPARDQVRFAVGGTHLYAYHFWGRIDDFRIYNKELTQEEILYLAGVASVNQPLMVEGDADGDKDIDLGDYAVLANTFLSTQLWP